MTKKKKKEGESCGFFSSLAFVIAVLKKRGQLFFLQGANFASAIHDWKKTNTRGLQIITGLIKTETYSKFGTFTKCWC